MAFRNDMTQRAAAGLRPARPRLPSWGWMFDAAAALSAIAALGIFATQPAQRDDNPALAATASPFAVRDGLPGREVALGFYGGIPYTYPSDVSVRRPGVHDFTFKEVQWEGKPFVNPVYYGVRTTRWFNGTAGAMLDFTHSKAIALRDVEHAINGTLGGNPAPDHGTVDEHFGKLEASHGHNMLTLNGLLRLPGVARLHPYVGLGAGVSLPHMEVDIKGEPRTYEYQFAGPVGQALAGIELRLPRVSLFVEYKFTLAPYDVPLSNNSSRSFLPVDLWGQLQNWMSATAPPGGLLSTTFISHQAIGGLSIRLAPAATP